MGRSDCQLHTRTIPAIVLVLLVLPGNGRAQTSSLNYPVQFSQFFLSYPMTNPASTGVEDNYGLSMGYQRPVSGFTGISTYFCNVHFIPCRPDQGASGKSVIGIRAFNDNEGAFISRSRFYLTYAFHTSLAGNLRLSGGIDFGGMNFAVKATPTTEGASVLKADANTGIWLYNDRLHAGLSVNQLFRSVFRPLDERITLPTHINLTGSYALVSRDAVTIQPHILVTFPYYSSASIQACLYSLFYSRFIAAAGWNRGKNISFQVGVNDIDVFERGLDIVLSYSTNIHKASLSITVLELSVHYGF